MNSNDPLNSNINSIKGTRLKRGSSCMAKAEINKYCVPNIDIIPIGTE